MTHKAGCAVRIKGRGILSKIIILGLLAAALIWAVIEVRKPVVRVDSYGGYYGYHSAKVLKVLMNDISPDDVYAEGNEVGTQQLEIEFTDGPLEGQTTTVYNYLTPIYNVNAKEGTMIIVRVQRYDGNLTDVIENPESVDTIVYNYNRGIVLGVFILIFTGLVILVGGRKGLAAILGLFFSLLCLWFLLVPLLMRGYPMLPTTLLIVIVVASASLLILGGFTTKAYTAILGCVLGVGVAGLSTWLVGSITPLSGFNMEEAERLIYYATDQGMRVSGLLVCGVLIASIGAVLDVAMSISSAVYEIVELNPDIGARRLFKSGMNIGKDAMGATANTLVLALMGSSLNTFVLSYAYEIPFVQLINTDFIVVELVQAIAATIGIVATVPFVALLSAQIMTKHGWRKETEQPALKATEPAYAPQAETAAKKTQASAKANGPRKGKHKAR
jgi:uncharacterized membrane protein